MSHRLGMAAWLADTEREFILHLSRIRPAFAPCGIISYLTASATRKPKYGAAYKPKICAKAYNKPKICAKAYTRLSKLRRQNSDRPNDIPHLQDLATRPDPADGRA